ADRSSTVEPDLTLEESMSRKIYLLALLVLSIAGLSLGVVRAQTPVKVALILPSTINDLAWSESIYDSLVTVQNGMGGESALQIAYSENLYDVTAAAQAMRDYAEQGYDLVIAHGSQYGTSLFELAKDYPTTSFAWGTSNDTGASQG